MSPEKAGMWVGTLILALPGAWFLSSARRAGTASLRLSDFSLGLGLLLFIFPNLPLELNPADHPAAWAAVAWGKALCGLAGLACAVLALIRRRTDSGTSVGRPITGAALSGLHALMGVSMIVIPAFHARGTGGAPWKYTEPAGRASITLPSPDWKEVPQPQGKRGVWFFNPRLNTVATLIVAEASDQDFQREVEAFKKLAAGNPGLAGPPEYEEPPLASGVRCAYATARSVLAQGPGEGYFAQLQAWKDGVMVTVLFEARITALSGTFRSSQLAAAKETARRLCLSVEFAR